MDKYCTNCGQELANDSRFCTGCGIPLSKSPSFYTPEADAPVPNHTSVSLYTPDVPPDMGKAVNDLDASIAELDRVMKLHGMQGVMEQFEKPRQVVGGFILNNSSGNSLHSQNNKIESGVGTGASSSLVA